MKNDDSLQKLEDSLWEAADQLRANSNLGSTEYFLPVMGLIFLRHAYNRFLVVRDEIQNILPRRGGVARKIGKDDFSKKNALFLREGSQFEYLLNLKDDEDKGAKIDQAMDLIENDYDSLKGVLPKEYHNFDNDLLTRLLKIFNAEALRTAGGDLFGRIYEYFLMNFAMQGAHDSGEFFTPVSLVQTIVNVIEPDHGTVFDPACGSGGMFVQSSHFIENEGRRPSDLATFYGQEKTATTIRLAKMNLAVHGLEGKIVEGNTFYEDHHEMLAKADFVMANPPFNVDSVDAGKIKRDPRLPFGLPGVNKKEAVSNGNYLWISYFHSYLNKSGRAGFVMSSQASSAGRGEQEVRRKLVETGDVDVMISIRSNFFYTRTVPCELWFFDKGKPKDRRDQVLMLDARNIFHKVNRKIFDFTPEQLQDLTTVVALYRGQNKRLEESLNRYFEKAIAAAGEINEACKAFKTSFDELLEAVGHPLPPGEGRGEGDKAVDEAASSFFPSIGKMIGIFSKDWKKPPACKFAAQKQAAAKLEPLAESCRDLVKDVDQVARLVSRLQAVPSARGTAFGRSSVNGSNLREKFRALDERRQELVQTLKEVAYFQKHIHWLVSRFPDGWYADVQGLCKLVDRKEIEANDWSLTPGRYVGVAPVEEDEDFDFEETLRGIHVELADLNKESAELAKKIQKNFEELAV